MRIVLDSNVIIDVERRNEEAVSTVKELVRNNEEVLISTVTVSEILIGSYFKENPKLAVAEAKKVLTQFQWIDLNPKIAEKTAEYWAHLIKSGKPAEYQDVAIAATTTIAKADYLLTSNKKHFTIPDLRGKVYSPSEFAKLLKGK